MESAYFYPWIKRIQKMHTNTFLFTLLIFFYPISFLIADSQQGDLQFNNSQSDSAQVMGMLEEVMEFAGTDYKKAIHLAMDVREKTLSLKQPGLTIAAELSLSKLYFNLGLYQESLQFILRAIDIAKENEDILALAKIYLQLGSHRLVLEDYSEAKSYIDQAMGYFLLYYGEIESIDLLTKVIVNNNLGLIYAGLEDMESAEKYYRSAITLLDDSPGLGIIAAKLYNNLADILNKSGRKDEALEHYLIAKKKLLLQPDLLVESMLENSLGRLYSDIGAYQDALMAFHKGLAIAKKVDGYSHLHHLSKGLANLHERSGYLDSAYTYLSMSKAYEDSLKLRKLTESLLAEELKSNFNMEKSQLLKIYENNKKFFFIAISFSILLVLGFYIRALIIRKRLQSTEIEKLRLEQVADESSAEARKLKEKVEQTQKELALLSIQNIRKDEMIKALSKSAFMNDEDLLNKNNELKVFINGLKSNGSERALLDFEYRFGNIYIGFFEKLMEKIPSLSPKERRICAFLKLQLTTKEICLITGQSSRAIEMARIRIRRKLKLTNSNANLNDYFLNF